MQVVLHPKVQSDVDAVMNYYVKVTNEELANNFYTELRRFISYAAKHPSSFSVRQHDLRRVNLHRFPYHFLFRIVDDTMRVLVVRHHRKHPAFGTSRC